MRGCFWLVLLALFVSLGLVADSLWTDTTTARAGELIGVADDIDRDDPTAANSSEPAAISSADLLSPVGPLAPGDVPRLSRAPSFPEAAPTRQPIHSTQSLLAGGRQPQASPSRSATATPLRC